MGRARPKCGSAARSHGESSPETSRPATAGLPGLGDWPGHNPGDRADSSMDFTLAQEHQRAQTTTESANRGTALLRPAIARAIERG
jgi:hypothetical protein